MKVWTLAVLGGFVAFGAGCGGGEDAASAPESAPGDTAGVPSASAPPDLTPVVTRYGLQPAGSAVDYVFDPHSKLLPAHKHNDPLPVGKADFADDVRYYNPQHYALTVPPKANIRPMVEYEPMQAIVMGWPGGWLSENGATNTAVQIGVNASKVAEVWYIVDSANAESGLRQRLSQAGVDEETLTSKVKFLQTNVDTVWFIDYGPLPIVDTDSNTFAFADFRYDGSRVYDDGIPTLLGRALPELGLDNPADTYRMPLSTEGGTFQATMDGYCFTATRTLYYMSGQNVTNLPLDQVQTHEVANYMRGVLQEYAGCKDLIVLYDITDDGTGHLDMFFKAASDEVLVVGDYREPYENPQQQTNAQRMNDNVAFLEAFVKEGGGKFTVKRLVMPGHRSSNFGAVPFTYINSTIINGINLWPATEFADWEESRNVAQAEWDDALPEHDNIWIDATNLSFYSGAIHCITRTIPDLPTGPWIPDGVCDGCCQGPPGGYAGSCNPNGSEEEVCWGPEWMCTCNNCQNGCTYTPGGGGGGGCGAITFTGCCEGDTYIKYCNNGELVEGNCEGGCGWDSGNNYYDCNQQAGSEDPTGENPRACSEVEGNAPDPGDCVPDCSCKDCGSDGCGGSCGECAEGLSCTGSGKCVGDCTDECGAGEGGCEGDVSWSCEIGESGCLVRVETDCAEGGDICEEGVCVAPPEPEPGPEPEPEPAPEGQGGSGGATGGTGGNGGEGGAGVNTGNGSGGGGGASGCSAGAEGASPALALGLLALLAMWRRRRLVG